MSDHYGNSLNYSNNSFNNSYNGEDNSLVKSSFNDNNGFIYSPVSEEETSSKKRRKGQRNYRKVVIEKRRRDRINLCLDELRKLVPAVNEKQGSAKLEKAEVLKMTVDHLKRLYAKGFDPFKFNPHKFSMEYHSIGFKECANEISKYLLNVEGFTLDDPLKLRLITHLRQYFIQKELTLKSTSMNKFNSEIFLKPASIDYNLPKTTVLNKNSNDSNSCNYITTNLATPTTITQSNSFNNFNNIPINSRVCQQLNLQNNSMLPHQNSLSTNTSLTASQLLNQHTFLNEKKINSQVNTLLPETILNLNSNSQNTFINSNTNSSCLNENQRNLINNMMPPPPLAPQALIQKVNVLNELTPHSSNSADLTYTNMNPSLSYSSVNNNYQSSLSHTKLNSNQISGTNYSTQCYIPQNHQNHQFINNPFVYTSTVNHKIPLNSSNLIAIPVSNESVITTLNNTQNNSSQKYCRPWGAGMVY